MTSLEGGLGILSCRRKTDIAISVGAGHCTAWNNCLKTAQPTRTYQGPQLSARRSSVRRYGELENFQEQQELPLLLWLDTASRPFWVSGHCATYTGSFFVFGPGLSSPAHGLISLAMG
jgi:hypothetical protein